MNDAAVLEPGRLELPGFPSKEALLKGVRKRLRRIGLVMAGFADAAENTILDSAFGDGSTNIYTAPTYLALLTAAAGEADTGSTLTEANYTGYARKALSAADMNAAAAGSKTNGVAQSFAACTAGSSVVIGWGVCSASTAGTLILFGTCTSTTISTTQTPATIGVGGLVATLD